MRESNGAPERVEPLKNCTAILGGTPGKLCLKGRKSERGQNERIEWRAREDYRRRRLRRSLRLLCNLRVEPRGSHHISGTIKQKNLHKAGLLFNGAPERVEPLKNCTAILGGTPGKLCLKGRKSERGQNERIEWRAREDYRRRRLRRSLRLQGNLRVE